MKFNIQTWKQSSHMVYNSLSFSDVPSYKFRRASYYEVTVLSNSRSIVGKCCPAKNHELRFPASHFPVLGIR